MAITVDWVTGVVSVPKADTTLTGTDPISGREIRSFDTDQFHVDLRIQEDSLEGRTWPVTHDYNADATFGGTTYAPQFVLKNSYTVEFEEVVTPYRVVFTSTNNNIADYSVVNNVSIQPGNSAGLQIVTQGSGVTSQDITDIAAKSAIDVWTRVIEGTMTAEEMQRIAAAVLWGDATGLTNDSPEFWSIMKTKVRVQSTMAPDGSRTNNTMDGT